MSYAFRCPTCHTAIADVPGPGVVDATCSRCRYTYRVATGPVEVASTRETALVRHGAPQPGQTEREYDLRIRPAPGTVQIATFRRPRGETPVSLGTGDLVTLAHTLRGTVPDRLAVVVNHTAQQTHVLARPGTPWLPQGPLFLAGIVAVGLVAAFALGSPLPFVAALMLMMVFAIVGEHAPRPRELPPEQIGELQRTETLLERKQKLAHRHRELGAEHARREALAGRLRALREKMEAVGAEHYRTRMRTVDAALRVLDRQLETGTRLLAQYERTQKLVEIEIETGTLLAGVADADAAEIQHAMDELQALQAAHEDLQRHVAATDEVERLLRG